MQNKIKVLFATITHLPDIQTHLAYRVNVKKKVIYQTIIHSFESARTEHRVICYCKMTSVMALDGVTLFLYLKDVTNSSKRMRPVQLLAGILQSNGGKLEEAEDFKYVFVVYCMLESK